MQTIWEQLIIKRRTRKCLLLFLAKRFIMKCMERNTVIRCCIFTEVPEQAALILRVRQVRVIILDQLGVLRSDAIAEDEDYGMEYQVEMFEEMRKVFGIEKWSILGHSYGGMLAVLYAQLYPDSIHKMILDCPSLWFEDSARSVAEYLCEHIESHNNREESELCEKLITTDYQGGKECIYDLITLLNACTDMQLRNYLHGVSFEEYQKSMDTSEITNEMWAKGDRHLEKLLEKPPVQKESYAQRVTMMDNFMPMIQKITLPVLLINGKFDPACTKRQIEYVLNNVRNITQIVFENSGHFPRIEEAEKYTNVVLDFLEK